MGDVARDAYIAASEVTTLEHEVWNDPMELGSLVAEALRSGAKLEEVLGRLGILVVVEFKIDAATLVWSTVST